MHPAGWRQRLAYGWDVDGIGLDLGQDIGEYRLMAFRRKVLVLKNNTFNGAARSGEALRSLGSILNQAPAEHAWREPLDPYQPRPPCVTDRTQQPSISKAVRRGADGVFKARLATGDGLNPRVHRLQMQGAG